MSTIRPIRVNTTPPVRRSRFPRIRRAYTGLAIITFNTLLLYVGLNVALGVAFAVRDHTREETNPVSQTYGKRLDQVYPNLPEPERTRLLCEVWNRPYQYADFTHFEERPFAGQYVNVKEAGYRVSANQGPWPISRPNLNVFCFGGSTLFGYGVSDDQTVASYLQTALQNRTRRRVAVYNFGVGWHYSTQERLRFEKLLAQDIVPDVALFLDGINDSTQGCIDRPAFSLQMSAAFERTQGFGVQSPARGGSLASTLADTVFFNWPIGRATRRFLPAQASSAPELVIITPEQAQRSSEVYRWNRELISAAARLKSVEEIFVVQPSPGYKLDRAKHPLWNEDWQSKEEHYYVALKKDLDAHPPGDRLLWCADLCETTDGPLYVDACHYTPHFADALAKDIVRKITDRRLLDHLLNDNETRQPGTQPSGTPALIKSAAN